MRKFIIKYWFGQYAWKGFAIDRAGVYNTILMIIAILVNVFIENQNIAIPLMLLPVSILLLIPLSIFVSSQLNGMIWI